MAEWKTYRLGDICTLNYGKSLTATNRVAGDIPVYSSAGITGSHNVALVQSKGIIVGRKGTVGTVYYSDKPFYCIDTAYYILPDDEKYDFKWLYYRLKSLHLEKLNEDSAVPGLNRETAYAQEFPLPPLEEQRRIAGILSAIDDKIENNRRINTNLELQAQALYKQWFVDFEFPNEDGKPYKSSGGKMVDSELGQIPEGWSVQTISDISVRIASGGTPKSLNESYYNGEIKWFTTKELKDCFLIDSDKHISTEALNDSAAKLFPKNTILMAIYAAPTVGRLGILTAESTFNQAAVGIVAKEEIGHLFVYLTLLAERENLNNLASGAAQQNLNVGIVKQYKLIVPTKKLLIEFNQIAGSLFERIKVVSNENKTLATLRDTLLPKLMNGEIITK